MKKSLEITLTTIHLGSVKRVVTLGIDGKDLAYESQSSTTLNLIRLPNEDQDHQA